MAVVAQSCDLCGVPGHNFSECQLLVCIAPDQLNYAEGNPYSNTYNPVWKNYTNFSYKNNHALYAPNQPPHGYQKPAQTAPQAARKSNLELMMVNFVVSQTQ